MIDRKSLQPDRKFIFDGDLCTITAVHSTHVNFISRKVWSRGRLGPGYISGATIKDFLERAKPVPTQESVKRKIRVGELKRLIQATMLREADDPTASTPVPEEKDASLDAQVDRYLTQYETEAKSSQNEAFDFRSMTRRFLIEAGEDDDKADDKGDDDAAPAADAGAPAKIGLDKINMESFANSVVRLIDNYDSLLEVRSTLVRRAKNFLSKDYSPEVVDAFEKVMREEHGIVPGESQEDVDNEDFAAPPADRAGSGGEGGAPA